MGGEKESNFLHPFLTLHGLKRQARLRVAKCLLLKKKTMYEYSLIFSPVGQFPINHNHTEISSQIVRWLPDTCFHFFQIKNFELRTSLTPAGFLPKLKVASRGSTSHFSLCTFFPGLQGRLRPRESIFFGPKSEFIYVPMTDRPRDPGGAKTSQRAPGVHDGGTTRASGSDFCRWKLQKRAGKWDTPVHSLGSRRKNIAQ